MALPGNIPHFALPCEAVPYFICCPPAMMRLDFGSLCEVKGQVEKPSEARYKIEWGKSGRKYRASPCGWIKRIEKKGCALNVKWPLFSLYALLCRDWNLLFRCVYVGDSYAGSETIPRCEEQRCNWEDWEWRAVSPSTKLPTTSLQPHVSVLGIWTVQKA